MSIAARAIFANQYLGTGPNSANLYGDVYIETFDPLTNLPVDAEYRTISYTIIDLSGTTSGSVVIPGQYALIYSGLIYKPTPIYNITITIDSISGEGESGEGICDLEIESVTIREPESEVGAGDGSIRINAFSSYGPIEYSINNVDWQTSPIFTGLSGGLYTAYARYTPLGCSDTFSFIVYITEDILVSDPSTTVVSNISRWNAAFNPIRFKYQRKDFEILGTTEYSGRVLVQANVDSNELTLDEYVYVNSGIYEFTAKVLGVDVNGDSRNFVVDYFWTEDTTGGFFNSNTLVKYYEVETFVSFINLETDVLTTYTSHNTPDETGLVTADLQSLLRSALSTNDESDYTLANFRDLNLAASYQISFREIWDGYEGATVSIVTPFYVTFAARQLGQLYGGNMFEFVPFVSPVRAAKFLSDFAEPQYSPDYPFDLSFIYSEWMVGNTVIMYGQYKDINRNNIGGIITQYLLNDDESFLLNQDESRFIITDNAVDLNGEILPEQLGINRLLVNNQPIANAYYLELWLEVNGDEVTERKILRIDQNCEDDNSIYLRWIGLTGSWNYFRFNYNASYTLDVQDMSMVKNFVEDWASDKSIEKVINKNAGQKITLEVEDLDKSLILGLQSIKHSCEVQMLYQANPLKWQTIVLNTATFQEYETRYGAYNFGITFNLPSINTNSQ